MRLLKEKSDRLIQNISLDFQREKLNSIPWDWRLVSLIGARGVGKTTLLLQRAKTAHGISEEAIYVSMDDIYFTETRLVDFADVFSKNRKRSFCTIPILPILLPPTRLKKAVSEKPFFSIN